MRLIKKNFIYILGITAVFTVILSSLDISNEKTAVIVLLLSFLFFSYLICHQIEKEFQEDIGKIKSFLESLLDRNGDKIEAPYIDSKSHIYLKEFSENLSDELNALETEKKQLETILETMNEGVIIISEKDQIILINPSAKAMFQLDDFKEEHPYWELIRNKELLDIISKAREKNISIKEEIGVVYPEEKFYLVSIELTNAPSTVIIVVIFNITEFKKLEQIKADLIANVSHELRTPLTSMKGYIETLIDEAYDNKEERDNFLYIIKRNTERLTNIVTDLLILSEIEQKERYRKISEEKEYENININEAITQSLVSLHSKIAEKNINEKTDIQTNISDFRGDKFLFEQMLTNLIDNAVKYTPNKGLVNVKASQRDNHLVIEVSDTGIGIPKEHQDRIFERFYRVDKDRSRSIGGTGLGLSIVKHIVIVHNGTIRVESEESMGTKFIVELPYPS